MKRRLKGWGLLAIAASLAGCSGDQLDLGQPRSCEIGDQNEWVYGVMKELYLWEEDMPEIDARSYDSPKAMIADLRVGHDRWSRVSDQARTEALFEEGKTVGFGFRTKRGAADEVIVASVHEDSPAGHAGLKRGDRFIAVGGQTVSELDDNNGWSDVYGESVPGVTVAFRVDKGNRTEEFSLTKDWIEIVTVPIHQVIEVEGHKVGYLFFQTFVATAEEELDNAFAEFNEAGVTDVIVDVRYNGGGLISISRHLTNLIVGNVAKGTVNYAIEYNANLADLDTSRDVEPVGNSLKSVGKVAFLTTGTTLSASELLINAVRAHTDVEIVGDITGGKPVGSKHINFCDSTLAPITFRLLNANGVSDYFDGLDPTCVARDDLTRPLGDEREETLAAALSLITGHDCPAIPADDYERPPERQSYVDEMPELAGWK